jgi:hypothetical protein
MLWVTKSGLSAILSMSTNPQMRFQQGRRVGLVVKRPQTPLIRSVAWMLDDTINTSSISGFVYTYCSVVYKLAVFPLGLQVMFIVKGPIALIVGTQECSHEV